MTTRCLQLSLQQAYQASAKAKEKQMMLRTSGIIPVSLEVTNILRAVLPTFIDDVASGQSIYLLLLELDSSAISVI